MNCHSPTPDSTRLRIRVAARSLLAFSLIEVLVVMALLSIIVIGLLAMFNQTQRAFRVGLTQTDVLESGRVTGDFLRRELEQITPSHQSGAVNFDVWLPNYIPLEQGLPGSTVTRTNLCEDLFFLTKVNQEWIGIGYFVRSFNPNTGAVEPPSASISAPNTATAGSLYRFEWSIPAVITKGVSALGPDYLFTRYNNAAYTNYWPPNGMAAARISKIADGVVHFKVRTFNTNGNRIVPENLAPYTNGVSLSGVQTNATLVWSARAPGEVSQYRFFSNAVPAAVEVEFGILEDKVWQRFKNLPTPNAQYSYLTGVVGRVHVFRQRVQVRNVDPIAYQ